MIGRIVDHVLVVLIRKYHKLGATQTEQRLVLIVVKARVEALTEM